MGCNYPGRAYRIGDKLNRPIGVVFALKQGYNVLQEIKVPCGQCLGCNQKRVRDWALRCQHEARMWEHNYFITLTYNDEHLPDGNSLCYSDFQAFMKKARHWMGIFDWKTKKQWDKTKIRFFMCGEYGKLNRPHYHVLLFNFPIPDLEFLKETEKGSRLYTSELVSWMWNNRGFITVGSVEYQSAAYVAQYCVKKMGSEEEDYQLIDLETGELFQRSREMIQMSRRPGIGSTWYDKYKEQIFPVDLCIANGKKVPVPKYYSIRHKKEDPSAYEDVIAKRQENTKHRMADNTEERLLVKEECLKARINFYSGDR